MSKFWSECIDEIKSSVSKEIFINWFSDLTADEIDLESSSITIYADSTLKLHTVERNYGEKISEIISRRAQKNLTVNWAVRKNDKKTIIQPSVSENNSTDYRAKTGLLPNLTFETFVKGNANQMACAAALQVANSSNATIYNPMIIYGGVGLGKTHLMHAIGHRYLENNPKARVLCISAQQYMEEFTNAMQLINRDKDRNYQAIKDFEAKYQNLDLLLIDDIQSFASRSGTQTNFFQVFEHMVPHGKQIVMTSDTFPRNLKEFQERLLSRITQGLTVEVEPPELDMRIAILLQKAALSGLVLKNDVAEIIARRLKSNVRELEGAVQQILAYTNFQHVTATIDNVQIALRDLFRSSAVPVTIEAIQQHVANYYNIKIADMYSKKRTTAVARPRQIAMFLAKELTQKSLPEIGQEFGGRDHTTVLYACKKITSDKTIDEALRHDLHILEQRIKN